MKNAIGLAAFSLTVLFLAPAARADVPPPETEPCVGKQVAEACVYNGSGTCQNQTCSRIDYSTGGSTTYPCVKCVVGTPTDTNTNTNTNADGGTPPEDDDDGACSIGQRTTSKRVVPWLLGAAFSLLFLWRRRRR
jgi:hypothetical protein